MGNLHEILGLPFASKHIISVCGAGGKSTLINCLAREAVTTGAKVCIMTTTRFKRPEDDCYAFFSGNDTTRFEEAWRNKKIVVAGEKGYVFGVRPPLPDVYRYVIKEAKAVYIEADGSKQLPIKFPGDWEPVIPQETEKIILVAGLRALGKPLADVCHRIELIEKTLQPHCGELNEQMFAKILLAGYLSYHPIVVLNQADTPELVSRGEKVANILRCGGLDSVHVLSLKNMFGLEPDETTGELLWRR